MFSAHIKAIVEDNRWIEKIVSDEEQHQLRYIANLKEQDKEEYARCNQKYRNLMTAREAIYDLRKRILNVIMNGKKNCFLEEPLNNETMALVEKWCLSHGFKLHGTEVVLYA